MARFSLKSMPFQRKCCIITSCIALTAWIWSQYFIFHQTINFFYLNIHLKDQLMFRVQISAQSLSRASGLFLPDYLLRNYILSTKWICLDREKRLSCSFTYCVIHILEIIDVHKGKALLPYSLPTTFHVSSRMQALSGNLFTTPVSLLIVSQHSYHSLGAVIRIFKDTF